MLGILPLRKLQDRAKGLSTRLVRVLHSVVRGSTRVIAARFHNSERTVEHYPEYIHAKIGVYPRDAAALFAAHNGLWEV
jgi:DNA-binding NarL/FixJ family response regulator